MSKRRKNLSQAEVWDDSALIRSWDDALEEYKLYHSIHARGEKVEDVLNDTENESQLPKGAGTNGARHKAIIPDVVSEDLEDGELDEEDRSGDPSTILNCNILPEPENQTSSLIEERHQQCSPNAKSTFQNNVASSSSNGAAMLSVTLGEVQDEALKNLMMSWYYAGYYSGLYESQQKLQKQANADNAQHNNSTG